MAQKKTLYMETTEIAPERTAAEVDEESGEVCIANGRCFNEIVEFQSEEDAAFARHARTALPAAVREIERLRAENERTQRLADLVRYARHQLHTDGLITDEEFAEIAKDHPAVARLESYDSLQAQCDELRKALESHGRHSEDCPVERLRGNENPECACGLGRALALLDKEPAK